MEESGQLHVPAMLPPLPLQERAPGIHWMGDVVLRQRDNFVF